MGFGTQERVTRNEATDYTSQRKQVFGSHSDLAHVWAQQSFAYGRASDGRMYFEGATIYSYGHHFPMATFTPYRVDGQQLVLVNSRSYSVSTGKHQRHVWHALRGLSVITADVPNLTELRIDAAGKITGSKAELNAAFDALLIDAASVNGGSLTVAHAFKRAAKLGRDVPADLGAWNEKRLATIKAKGAHDKLDNAKRIITAAHNNLPTLKTDGNTWNAGQQRDNVKRDLTALRGARNLVSKNGFSSYVAKARKTIAALATLHTQAIEIYEKAHAAENRERHLRELDAIVSGERAYFVDQDSSAARLFKLASDERRPDDARKVLDLVQVIKLRTETAWRAPREEELRYSYRTTRKLVTAENWIEGAGDANAYHLAETLVRRKGDRLETSRGARAPWKLCVAAFLIAQECRRTGTAWHKNGERCNLGSYELDSVSANGTLRAGCHTIQWDEILRLATREIPEHVAPLYPLPAVCCAASCYL